MNTSAFPLDDSTLSFLKSCLRTTIEIDADGNPQTPDGQFTISQALGFLSGVGDNPAVAVRPGFDEVRASVWSESDLIEALIHEVERLRAIVPEADSGTDPRLTFDARTRQSISELAEWVALLGYGDFSLEYGGGGDITIRQGTVRLDTDTIADYAQRTMEVIARSASESQCSEPDGFSVRRSHGLTEYSLSYGGFDTALKPI